MSYEPYEWKDGDIINASKLNRIENGIAEANTTSTILLVNLTNDGNVVTSNKTAGEILDVLNQGGICFAIISGDNGVGCDFISLQRSFQKLTTDNNRMTCSYSDLSNTIWNGGGIK